MPSTESKIITILIADDEPLARAGIRALLTQAQDIESD
jgi:DNA-binding NarL/FixJ family response regulator